MKVPLKSGPFLANKGGTAGVKGSRPLRREPFFLRVAMVFKIEPDWEGEAHYTITFDGGSEGNPGPAYGSFAIVTKDGRKRIYRLSFGEMTANEAEYRTLASALAELISILDKHGRSPQDFTVEVRGDSALVINQVLGLWKTNELHLRKLRDEVRGLLSRFKAWRLVRTPREQVKKELGH